MKPLTQSQKIMEGLRIFETYNPANYDVCAEHDEIYAGHEIEVSEVDKATLIELGWRWCAETYDSWVFFV